VRRHLLACDAYPSNEGPASRLLRPYHESVSGICGRKSLSTWLSA
jgi:hypothetical protein